MRRLSTGTSVLDELLEGGYERDAVTTIYGPAGSGKTNLAVLASVGVARKGKKVIYIDTEGGFSVERLKQVAPAHKKILQRIVFLNPTNFKEQKKSFEKLSKLINSSIGLIVVDTMTMLYRLERTLGDNEFNRELAQQIQLLTEISRKKKIPALITTQVYTSFNSGLIHPVGGDILKYGSKCLLELQALHRGKRKAIIRKHRSIAGEKESLFEIVAGGVQKVTPR